MASTGFKDKLIRGAASVAALGLACLALSFSPPLRAQTSADGIELSAMVDASLQPVNSTKALKTSEESVVRVLVVYHGAGGATLDSVGMGSGFVVAPGFIVTNYHVVEVPPEASSADIYIVPHKDTGATYQPVQLVKSWTDGDLALLEAKGLKVAPLKLYLSPQKNDRVVAMGYPDVTDHMLNRTGTELLVPSDAYVTQGSIALFASTNPDGSRVDTLFHTAPINHGNSGGPLLNECGQVVGVNTWTAPSTISASGDVDMVAGQFVATHVSALNTFLGSAGMAPQLVSTPCFAKSADEIVKDDALARVLAANADAQADRQAEQKKAEADRAVMERWLLGGIVVLSLLVLTLIGLIISRDRRLRLELHHKEKDAPTAFSGDADKSKAVKPEKVAKPKVVRAPPKHPIPWGWILLGLIIVTAVIIFVVKDHDIYRRLTAPHASAGKASVPILKLTCEVDRGASPRALSGAGPIDIDFDAAHACVNGRVPYERQDNGALVRFTVSDSEPVAARLELSPDGLTLKRSDYRLGAAEHKAYVDQKAALGSLRCSADMGDGASAALNENLARVRSLSQTYLTMAPDTQTVWRCHKKPE